MKKIILGGFLVAVILRGVPDGGEYAEVCTVTEIFGDEYTLTDGRGENWIATGENLFYGREYMVVFNDRETPEIYDDEIVEIYEVR